MTGHIFQKVSQALENKMRKKKEEKQRRIKNWQMHYTSTCKIQNKHNLFAGDNLSVRATIVDHGKDVCSCTTYLLPRVR